MPRLCFLALLLISVFPVLAKDKKPTLPAEILRAHKVLLVIRPDAEESLSDPDANFRAEQDIREALSRWNRFQVVSQPYEADLVIAIRKGTGHFVSSTVEGNPMDRGQVPDRRIGIGSTPPDSISREPADSRPHAGLAVGKGDDLLEVYIPNGGIEHTLEGAPAWRYEAKDGLKAPTLPAVERFRKAIEDADRAASKKASQP